MIDDRLIDNAIVPETYAPPRSTLSRMVWTVARMMCATNGRITHQYWANDRRDAASVVAVRHSYDRSDEPSP